MTDFAGANADDAPGFRGWAKTPPMGWNSWDCFGTTVTEAQVRAQADVMARELLAHGWQYLVVDIQWYEPSPSGHSYRPGAPLVMDGYGRLQPAPNRFPSSRGGKGFAPLAEHVHSLGLKFGVHLMRGIPRIAVEQNLPLWGSEHRARDIANRADVCPWNPDMYGVDMSKPGAQAYYDSIFALLASWSVDYVKVDDIARPYHDHEREIEGIRRAIDKTGREIVLSLSPGETAISAASHVQDHANLWRISDDFWDNWISLREQFARVRRWNPHRRLGNWPDADMLPLGVLDLGRRRSRFTREEQLTVMSLWAIARSPLMFGGDMTQLDDDLRALLVNDRVIAINQHSQNNEHLFDNDGLIAWAADVPNSTDKYLALFNARDHRPLLPEAADAALRSSPGQAARIDVDLSRAERLVLLADDGADNSSHHYIAWGCPTIHLADGREVGLSRLIAEQAISWWGNVAVDRGDDGRALSLAGTPQAHGLGAHTKSYLEYSLPAEAVRFTAQVGFEDGHCAEPNGAARFLVFAVPRDEGPIELGLPVEVSLERLGFDGAVDVRDVWSGRWIGEFTKRFRPLIAWHGAGLFRLSENAGPARLRC
jgi:alpha-galactosidase